MQAQILALVTPEGITSAAIADQLIARHPDKSPVWVRHYVKQILSKAVRRGWIERDGVGEETLYARVKRTN